MSRERVYVCVENLTPQELRWVLSQKIRAVGRIPRSCKSVMGMLHSQRRRLLELRAWGEFFEQRTGATPIDCPPRRVAELLAEVERDIAKERATA